MRLYLVGFMGSGKTTLGKWLAEGLNCHFIDLDAQIEISEQQSISEIFEQKGEPYFREVEAKALRETHILEKTIIATGGGAPCFHQNMDWMNENGITLYLSVSAAQLAERLYPEREKRPLLAHLDMLQLLDFIANKLNERSFFYEKAHLELRAESDPGQAIAALAAFLSRFL
jgi:shikimate kinase